MKNYSDILVSKLNDLYNVYERYAWKCDKCKIIVMFQDNCITFYINDDGVNIDEFILTFSSREGKLYKYIALKVFDMILGDVYIYKDNNEFYNKGHKPYLNVIVNDEDILMLVNQLVFNQEDEFLSQGINKFFKVKPLKILNAKFFNSLDNRLEISKKIFRGRMA